MGDQPGGGEKVEERFPGKYLSLTSYKRDGTGVATRVWFVIDDGRLLVMTDPPVIQGHTDPPQPRRDHRAVYRYRTAAQRPGSRPGRAAAR